MIRNPIYGKIKNGNQTTNQFLHFSPFSTPHRRPGVGPGPLHLAVVASHLSSSTTRHTDLLRSAGRSAGRNGEFRPSLHGSWMIYLPHMLHGAGIFTYIWVIFRANVGKYSSTMEHMGVLPYQYPHRVPDFLSPSKTALP